MFDFAQQCISVNKIFGGRAPTPAQICYESMPNANEISILSENSKNTSALNSRCCIRVVHVGVGAAVQSQGHGGKRGLSSV